jgi:hypothetical protein
MRSGIAQGEDGAPGVTRRVVRLLVLLGAVVAAYLVLSLFDHAARADAGSIDQSIGQIGAPDPVASAKAVAAGKATPEPKSIIPKSSASRAHPQRIHRPTIKMPAVHPPKVQTPKKIHVPRIQAPRKIQAPRIRPGETVRWVQVRTSKLGQHTPNTPELPDLPQAALTSWTWPPAMPEAELPAMPQLPSWPQLPGLPPGLTRITALSSALVPHQPLTPPVSAQVCPLPQPPAVAPVPGLSGVTKPPAAQAQPRTLPFPAPPRQPADRSTPTGQARDSGGGNAPATGAVSSSWRPEVAAAGRRPATDLIARGRTVRYAGPPS